jgi:hypothetical protein
VELYPHFIMSKHKDKFVYLIVSFFNVLFSHFSDMLVSISVVLLSNETMNY